MPSEAESERLPSALRCQDEALDRERLDSARGVTRAFRALAHRALKGAALDPGRRSAFGAAFDRTMGGALPGADLAPWSLHLRSQVFPALSTLDHQNRRGWVVLSGIDPSCFSLVWFDRRRKRRMPRLAVVCAHTTDIRHPEVVVDVGFGLECGFCGRLVYFSKSHGSLVGSRPTTDLLVAPICFPCRLRADRDAAYEREAWDRLSSRTLRLTLATDDVGRPGKSFRLVRNDSVRTTSAK